MACSKEQKLIFTHLFPYSSVEANSWIGQTRIWLQFSKHIWSFHDSYFFVGYVRTEPDADLFLKANYFLSDSTNTITLLLVNNSQPTYDT